MRVCFVSTELAGFGSFGGFGFMTWQIAQALAGRGLDVYAAMPRKPGQRPVEKAEGLTVVSYPSGLYRGLKKVMPYVGVYTMIDADIYHSQEPSLGTRLAQLGAPRKKHVITHRDPRTIEDWRRQWAPRELSRLQEILFLRQYDREVGMAVRSADRVFCKAKSAIDRTVRIYRLNRRPEFLPDPIFVPEREPEKAPRPTVCFLGRWDHIKRPELFFDLAGRFANVMFVALGGCANDPDRDRQLRSYCQGFSNIELPGWVGGEKKSGVLARSWILINTSIKEALPVSYLEACAYKCAILSHCNADEFASDFGYWAKTGDIGDFARGLEFLLNGDKWREFGEHGYEYVKNTYEFSKVIDQHIRVYNEVLSQ